MARIIGVHGVGQRGNPPPGIVNQWWEALHRGLVTAGVEAYGAQTDFNVAYYAGHYHPAGRRGMGGELDVHDLQSVWEEELVLALGGEAATLLKADEVTTRFVRVGRDLQRALNLILHVPGMGAVTESTLIAWFIKEVHGYFHDAELRQKAIQCVLDHLDPQETRVVIAHSLGSVVAYEALCQESFRVDTLVTVGSPLGLPKLIHPALRAAPGKGLPPWPGRIRCWVNLAQPGDVVALTKALAPLFQPGPNGQRIEDHLVDDPVGFFAAHNAEPYLARPELAAAVKQAFA